MKPRRDITLGEMQDECLKHQGGIGITSEVCYGCPHESWCGASSPDGWDLSDPPRFNEAQMALLKVFYKRGFRKVITGSTRDALVDCIREFLGIGEGVTLNLAELLGKDGAEC